jgi:hypothetical protein
MILCVLRKKINEGYRPVIFFCGRQRPWSSGLFQGMPQSGYVSFGMAWWLLAIGLWLFTSCMTAWGNSNYITSNITSKSDELYHPIAEHLRKEGLWLLA